MATNVYFKDGKYWEVDHEKKTYRLLGTELPPEIVQGRGPQLPPPNQLPPPVKGDFNPALSFGRMVSNIPGSAANVIPNILEGILGLPSAVSDIYQSTPQSGNVLKRGAQTAVKVAESIGQGYLDRYNPFTGVLQETIETDPIGSLLDVSIPRNPKGGLQNFKRLKGSLRDTILNYYGKGIAPSKLPLYDWFESRGIKPSVGLLSGNEGAVRKELLHPEMADKLNAVDTAMQYGMRQGVLSEAPPNLAMPNITPGMSTTEAARPLKRYASRSYTGVKQELKGLKSELINTLRAQYPKIPLQELKDNLAVYLGEAAATSDTKNAAITFKNMVDNLSAPASSSFSNALFEYKNLSKEFKQITQLEAAKNLIRSPDIYGREKGIAEIEPPKGAGSAPNRRAEQAIQTALSPGTEEEFARLRAALSFGSGERLEGARKLSKQALYNEWINASSNKKGFDPASMEKFLRDHKDKFQLVAADKKEWSKLQAGHNALLEVLKTRKKYSDPDKVALQFENTAENSVKFLAASIPPGLIGRGAAAVASIVDLAVKRTGLAKALADPDITWMLVKLGKKAKNSPDLPRITLDLATALGRAGVPFKLTQDGKVIQSEGY